VHTHRPDHLMMAGKIAIVRLVTIGVTVVLIQRYTYFRREAGAPHRYFAYALSGAIACMISLGLCQVFGALAARAVSDLTRDLPIVLLSGALCTVVAFCCNDWPEDTSEPRWLRVAEAGACAAVMALGVGLVYSADLMPRTTTDLSPRMLVAWFTLPSIMAAMLGACVPSIYRSARRAADARRNEALCPAAPARELILPFPALPPPPPHRGARAEERKRTKRRRSANRHHESDRPGATVTSIGVNAADSSSDGPAGFHQHSPTPNADLELGKREEVKPALHPVRTHARSAAAARSRDARKLGDWEDAPNAAD
jgi:hypothetical protein